MEVVAVLVELVLQRLATHAQGLPLHALLLQLATQQLRLLLGLGATLLGIAQFTVGVLQGQARELELFLHAHAPVEQLLEFHAQLFQRSGALLQVQAELFATLLEALELQAQALQRLARGVVLGAQRADTHSQLVSVVLVLTGLLADTVEALAQVVALGEQLLALLGVGFHRIQCVLQGQARFAELLVLDGALLVQFGQLGLQAAATQGELLDLGLLGGQLRLELTETTGFVLRTATLLLAAFLLLALMVAQLLQALLQGLQGSLLLVALGVQALQLLTPGQHAALGFAGTAHPQEIAPDPVAVTADEALVGSQRRAGGQGLVEAVHGSHPRQPGRQVDGGFDLVQQASGYSGTAVAGARQAQVALGEAAQVEGIEIVQQHGLQVGAEHGLHRQLPARLHAQALGQARALVEPLAAQPFGGAGAGVERGLLQGLE